MFLLNLKSFLHLNNNRKDQTVPPIANKVKDSHGTSKPISPIRKTQTRTQKLFGNQKYILGLVGEIASGKDTIAEYLVKNYGATTVSFSQPLRDIADRIYLEQSRKNLAALGKVLRAEFGQDILSKAIAQEVKQATSSIVVLPNVRLESDLKHLINEPNFILIAVEADQKIRYERLTKRRQNTDDAGKTWEEFLADSQLETEIHIRDLAQKALHKIDNNHGFVSLFEQIEQIIQTLKEGEQL